MTKVTRQGGGCILPLKFMKTKRLNSRDKEVVSVMIDLLYKGRPETRIAEYCLSKKMTEQQVVNLLNKLPHLSEPVKLTIRDTFRDLERDSKDHDFSRNEGYHLKQWYEKNYPKQKTIKDVEIDALFLKL